MKQHKLLVSLLIVFLFIVGINGVSAKSTDEKINDCESKETCKKICTFEKGHQNPLNEDKNDITNYTGKIAKDKDGNWIVYVTSDNKGLKNLYVDNKNWSSLFTDADKIKIFKKVYIKGSTEKEMKDGKCPEHMFVTVDFPLSGGVAITSVCFDNDNKSCEKIKGNWFSLSGNNDGFDDNNNASIAVTENGEEIIRHDGEEDKITILEPSRHSGEGCDGIFGEQITEDINTAFKIVKYIAPILIIVLSILDFIKAVSSGDGSDFNDAWKKLLKRLIVAILLFFVVVLLKYIFNIFGITVPDSCLK